MSTRARVSPANARRWWLSAAALGTGALVAGYFLDPREGGRRRHRLAIRSERAFERVARRRRETATPQPAAWPAEPPPDVDSE